METVSIDFSSPKNASTILTSARATEKAVAPFLLITSYAAFFTSVAITFSVSLSHSILNCSEKLLTGIFPIDSSDQATNSLSPCSPSTYPSTFLPSISKYFPSKLLSLAVSRTVPEPITLFLGKPDNLYVM